MLHQHRVGGVDVLLVGDHIAHGSRAVVAALAGTPVEVGHGIVFQPRADAADDAVLGCLFKDDLAVFAVEVEQIGGLFGTALIDGLAIACERIARSVAADGVGLVVGNAAVDRLALERGDRGTAREDDVVLRLQIALRDVGDKEIGRVDQLGADVAEEVLTVALFGIPVAVKYAVARDGGIEECALGQRRHLRASPAIGGVAVEDLKAGRDAVAQGGGEEGELVVHVADREITRNDRGDEIVGDPADQIEYGARKLALGATPLVTAIKALVSPDGLVKTDTAVVFLAVFVELPRRGLIMVFHKIPFGQRFAKRARRRQRERAGSWS